MSVNTKMMANMTHAIADARPICCHLKAFSYRVKVVKKCGEQRPTLGKHVGREEVLKRADDAGDEIKKYGGRKLGQGDVPELLRVACTIDLGGLVQAFGDGLQARQKHHHSRANTPQRQCDECWQGGLGAGKPLAFGKPQTFEHFIHQPDVGVEQPAPHKCGCQAWHNGGHVKRGAEEAHARQLLVEQQRRTPALLSASVAQPQRHTSA